MNSKYLLTVILSLVFSVIAIAQQNMLDVVYLKNGSIIKGIVIEQIPNQSIKIQTKDGSIFVYKIEEVEKITKETIEEKKTISEKEFSTQLKNELQITRLHNRKQLDLIGHTLSYGLTVVGDLAIGDGLDYPIILIPAVGSFLACGQVNDDDYFDPNDAKMDRTLFLISGIIQTAFWLDYLNSYRKESELRKKYSLNIQPTSQNIGLAVSINF